MDEPTAMTDTLDATAFQCDLYRYWRAVHAVGGISTGRRGYLTRASLRSLREQLGEAPLESGERERAGELSDLRRFFLRRLLERLGVLERDPETRITAIPYATMQRYFSLPLAARVRLCVRVWLAGAWWVDRPDERQALPGLRVPAPPRIALGRRRALQALLDASPGDVVPLPPARAAHTARARPGTAATTRGQRGPDDPLLADQDAFAAALRGPLSWLGLLAPVPSAQAADDPQAARVAGAIAAVLSLDPDAPLPPLHEASGRVVVQPNFEVVALPPLAAPTLMLLDACAEPRGSGSAATYALTRAACASARRSGWQSGTIVTRLEHLSRDPLPQNVRVTLSDWEHQVERVRVHRDVAVLEVRDPRLLDRLIADAQAPAWVARRVAPTVALLRADGVAAVRAWLLRHGELPALSLTLDQAGARADMPDQTEQARTAH